MAFLCLFVGREESAGAFAGLGRRCAFVLALPFAKPCPFASALLFVFACHNLYILQTDPYYLISYFVGPFALAVFLDLLFSRADRPTHFIFVFASIIYIYIFLYIYNIERDSLSPGGEGLSSVRLADLRSRQSRQQTNVAVHSQTPPDDQLPLRY